MTRRTLHIPGFADYCVDDLLMNPDGSFVAVNPAFGACPTGGGGGTPPPGQIVRSNITYVPSGTGSRINVPVTDWEDVFGHATATDAEVAFPGRPNSSPVVAAFTKTGYLALKIVVPSNIPLTKYGWITHTEYNYGADLTSSISADPGDFNPATALVVASTLSGQPLVGWRMPNAAYHLGATLQPGQTYYYNIKVTNPAAPWRTPPGNQLTCPIGFANAFGG